MRLVIDTDDGHSTMRQLDGEAQAFSAPAISPDGAAVGWLVHYPFCCTSYPVPLRLTILSAGTEHTFTGNELPIWRWRFLGDGSQVAFLQHTVRGDSSVHYELRDVEFGDLLDEWNSPVDRNNRALPMPADAPGWVVEFNDQ